MRKSIISQISEFTEGQRTLRGGESHRTIQIYTIKYTPLVTGCNIHDGSCCLILLKVCSAFESLKSTGARSDNWFNDCRMVQPRHMFLVLGLTHLLTCYTTASKFFSCSSPNPAVCIQAKQSLQ